MDDIPPSRPMPADREARSDAWHLAAPALVFLVHFSAVYGWAGLACAFGWGVAQAGPFGLVHAVVLALTVAALVALWWTRPASRPAPAADVDDPYDPAEREHFIASTSRLATALAAGGVVLVGVPTLLARTCAAGT